MTSLLFQRSMQEEQMTQVDLNETLVVVLNGLEEKG